MGIARQGRLVVISTRYKLLRELLTIGQGVVTNGVSWLVNEDPKQSRNGGAFALGHIKPLNTDCPCSVDAQKTRGAEKIHRSALETWNH